MKLSRTLSALVLAAALSVPSIARAKTYQVTGPVLEVTDKMIAIKKGSDRWEIDRTPDTKIDGDLKVGSKVTIYYHMTAEKVESKGSSEKSEKSSDKSADDKK
jgi:hypothetical protein